MNACINDIKRDYESTHLPNLSIALGEPFTKLEAVNGKLKIVESNCNKKMELFNKLFCVMASEVVRGHRGGP